jgi:hypothetical protein
MAIESWLPFGYELPDGAICRRARHGDSQWQIVDTDGGGRALIVHDALYARWVETRLVEEGSFSSLAFGPEKFHEISAGPNSVIEPVHEGKSPNSHSEAVAFATALSSTREFDRESALHDSIYVEQLNKLLPTYSLSTSVSDDLVLGYWLTGGAQVSVNSRRRINQLLSWLKPENISAVVSAAGIGQLVDCKAREGCDEGKAFEDEFQESQLPNRNQTSGLESGVPFSLAGRELLENFFNEHVIEIVRNKARYATLGIGFPSALVLHGPPGCGKTFAVEQLVEYLGWPSFQVDASTVASPFIHDTSKKVAEVFIKAMKNSPSVLIIDEMEAFLADREAGSGSSTHRIEEVAEFLRRIPEATKNEVLVVGMTNRIELIDNAILRRGRFDHVIQVYPATEAEVLALLEKLTSKLPRDQDVNLASIATMLSGRPLSDVAFVIREGARLSARSGSDKIAQKFLHEALASTSERRGGGSSRRIGFV